MSAKILIIDHNDSFTYNLAGLFESAEGRVRSVHVWSVENLRHKDLNECLAYDGVVLSAGPGLPEDYPAVTTLLNFLLSEKKGSKPPFIPVLGICLGLQTIVRYFGGRLYNLPHIQHGRQVELLMKDTASTKSDNALEGKKTGLPPETNFFNGLTTPIKVGLYHSWGTDIQCEVPELTVLATAQLPNAEKEQRGGVVMAISHESLPVWGCQFHPESYMTPGGLQMILNWLSFIEVNKSRS